MALDKIRLGNELYNLLFAYTEVAINNNTYLNEHEKEVALESSSTRIREITDRIAISIHEYTTGGYTEGDTENQYPKWNTETDKYEPLTAEELLLELGITGSGGDSLSGGDLAYREVSAETTLTNIDYTVDCTSNTFTVTLPSASDSEGKMYNIKNSGDGIITVATTSSQTIDGESSQLLYPDSNLQIQSTGLNWIIL